MPRDSSGDVVDGLVPDIHANVFRIPEVQGQTEADEPSVADYFRVVQDGPQEVYAAAGDSVMYTSIVPFPLRETLLIKNLNGRVVRTLLKDVPREEGSYADSWDGRDDSGRLLPDGPYFCVATATDGSKSITLDPTKETAPPLWWVISDGKPTAPDPLNNRPMTMPYRFDRPGRLTIRLRPASVGGVLGDCSPPRYCAVKDEYVESGSRVFTWGGADETGVYRKDFGNIDVVLDSSLPKNAVILYGSKPTVSNVSVNPTLYMPARGRQAVTFDLTTYESQPVTVKVTFLNQASRSILRTVTAEGVLPGAVSISWNGRSDNGARVAPGLYTVDVVVNDEIGNRVSGQILTQIAY